jgi:hypothetical protein
MIQFVPYEDMPDENEELAKFDIRFPPLDEAQAQRYGEFIDDLVDYLHDEGETVSKEDLVFIKPVQVKEQR